MKGYKVIVGLIALGFAAGIFGGYRIWGTTEKEKTDLKQLLQRVNDEVALIESKNRELTASLEASKEAINTSEAVRKENQDLKDKLQNALQEKQGLESTLAEVRAKEGENQDLMDRLQESQQKTTEKESLLQEVRGELSASREEAVQGEQLRGLTDDLNARISVLENENRELKSVIDNISEMTQKNEVPER